MNRRLYFASGILSFTALGILFLATGQWAAAFVTMLLQVILGMASDSIYKTDHENNHLKNKISDLTSLVKTPVPFNLPLNEKAFRKRQELYSIIRPCRTNKMEWKEIILMLELEHPDLPRDENTLRDTLNAGDAGCLDVWPPDLDEWRRLEQEFKQSKSRNSGF